MSKQISNFEKYKKSLTITEEPILLEQFPKIKMDLAGLSHYAKEKGVSLYGLSTKEIDMFVPGYSQKISSEQNY